MSTSQNIETVSHDQIRSKTVKITFGSYHMTRQMFLFMNYDFSTYLQYLGKRGNKCPSVKKLKQFHMMKLGQGQSKHLDQSIIHKITFGSVKISRFS